jgi:protein-tyrosine-phosphatase/DNA-binding transcriptional ArsR family regulator
MNAADAPPAILPLLADPTRWRLLSELARSDRRVRELVELVGQPQNVVSYHLAALRSAGLVIARRSSASGREVYYRADLRAVGDRMAQVPGALSMGLAPPSPPPTGRPARRGRRRVLFLCTGNSARSQMAEALAVARSAGAVEARSAGSAPKPLHPHAVRVMAERGIDIAHKRSKHLDRFLTARFDRVITLCDKVREVCPEFPHAAAAAHWSIEDPSAAGPGVDTYPTFQRVADEIEDRVALLVAELAAQAREEHAHA